VAESPRVSVIIPCYNQAHFLGEAINSVLDQTCSEFEVIVIDDGSTDRTVEVARQFDVRCHQQTNQGLAAARNAGLGIAAADYLVFLDADDRLLPTALETGLCSLGGRPDCAFASGHCRLIQADGSPTWTPPQPCVRQDHYHALLRGNYIWSPATVMYRRAPLESMGGFNPAVSPAADYDIYLRLARTFPVHCHGTVVAEYRRHSASMSRDAALMLDCVSEVLRSQWQFVAGDKQGEAAYALGRWCWEELYLKELGTQVRSQLRSGGPWSQATQGMLTMARYYARRAGRKLYRAVGGGLG